MAGWLRRHRLPLIALTAAIAAGAGLMAASPWRGSGPAPPAVEFALTSVIDAGAPGLVAQVWGGRSWAEAKGLANLDRHPGRAAAPFQQRKRCRSRHRLVSAAPRTQPAPAFSGYPFRPPDPDCRDGVGIHCWMQSYSVCRALNVAWRAGLVTQGQPCLL
ncbi:MAG TPA: hypothetical protein VF204_07935, partial [Streptosporangiaceae bacterium]